MDTIGGWDFARSQYQPIHVEGWLVAINDDFYLRVRHRDDSNIHGIGWGSVVIVILNNDKWQPIVIVHGVIGWKRTIQFFVMVESQTSPALC